MKRRKFVVGLGSLAAGGSAVMSSNAFLAESSKRNFTVTTTTDANALTALVGGDRYGTKHSKEYTGYDNKHHLYVRIPRLNSGSKWCFDKLFKLKANLTTDDGIHKYWIENKYPGWMKGNYEKKDGKDRIRWFGQYRGNTGQSGANNTKLFEYKKPDGSKQAVWGRWLSGDGASVPMEPTDWYAVGICINTRGLPGNVFSSEQHPWTLLSGAKVNAVAKNH